VSLRGWWRARRGRLLQLWAVGLVASVVVTAASALGYLESWQARGLDVLLRLKPRDPPPNVVIVAIDSAAFEKLGRVQPIPRDYLARVIRGLQRGGAAAVGVDITLGTPTTPAPDSALARAILEFSDGGTSRVIVAGPLAEGTWPLGAATLGPSVMVGSPQVPVDADGLIRRVEPLVPAPSGTTPSLGVAVAARLGLPVPAAPGDLWPINYVGPAGSFTTLGSDLIAALADPATDVAADNVLRGSVAFIGGTFPESRDFYQTPHGLMPGVEVHATVLHMLATGRFIRPSSWATSLAVNVVVVLVAGVVLLLMRPLPGTIVCVAGSIVLGVPASYLAFAGGGYWVDFVVPVLATSVMGLGTEALARRRIRDTLGRHLSKEVLERVVDDAPSLLGERREVSVLFSDLRGYTTLSEGMTPEAIAAHLNEYFEAMTVAIFKHRGMINDFIGDAVMAVFGAPVADPDHALHAVQSADAMQRALDELNRGWAARGLPLLQMGIGVHTGQVFAGNIGGQDRIKYTLIGDAVNVAARVKGVNKDLGTQTLITAEALAAMGARATVKDRGLVQVKGRAEAVRLYELLSVEPAS
jgi:adenylate cyclase